MRIRFYPIIALLFCALCFNGCFDLYFDVVQNSNGTFTIRQTVGIGTQLIQELSDFSGIGYSVKPSPKSILDSIKHTFGLRRDSLIQIQHIIGMSGISSLDIKDTTIDTMTYFSMEATVTNVDSLSGALHLMTNTSPLAGPDSRTPKDSDDVCIAVTRTKDRTNLMFFTPPKNGSFMKLDMPGMEELFKNLALHYRVFSGSLEAPHDKKIKRIRGGQERTFGLNELLEKGPQAHLNATFVIKTK